METPISLLLAGCKGAVVSDWYSFGSVVGAIGVMRIIREDTTGLYVGFLSPTPSQCPASPSAYVKSLTSVLPM